MNTHPESSTCTNLFNKNIFMNNSWTDYRVAFFTKREKFVFIQFEYYVCILDAIQIFFICFESLMQYSMGYVLKILHIIFIYFFNYFGCPRRCAYTILEDFTIFLSIVLHGNFYRFFMVFAMRTRSGIGYILSYLPCQ